jgi:hypothetical protein
MICFNLHSKPCLRDPTIPLISTQHLVFASPGPWVLQLLHKLAILRGHVTGWRPTTTFLNWKPGLHPVKST